jgi:hypothetical protein
VKASKEYKQWINNLRSRYARRNGVISSCVFDHPDLSRHLETDKKKQKSKSIDIEEQ